MSYEPPNWIERCSDCAFMFEDGYGEWTCFKRNTRCKFIKTCQDKRNYDACMWSFETPIGEVGCGLTMDDKGYKLCENVEVCPLNEERGD